MHDKWPTGDASLQQELLAEAVQFYLDKDITSQTDELLADSEAELAETGHHLLTSSDQFQLSAAHALRAGNEAAAMGSISERLLQPGAQAEISDGALQQGAVVDFIAYRLQAAYTSLLASKALASTPGYRLDVHSADFERPNSFSTEPAWPPVKPTLRTFTDGMQTGLQVVQARVAAQYDATLGSPFLSDGLKGRLQGHIEARLKTATQVRSHSGSALNTPNERLGEVYNATANVYRTLGQASIYLTIPRLGDPAFAPQQATNPARQHFDLNNLRELPDLSDVPFELSWLEPENLRPAVPERPAFEPAPPEEESAEPFDLSNLDDFEN